MEMDLLSGFLVSSPFSVVNLTPEADFPENPVTGWDPHLESHLVILICFTLFLLFVLQLFLHPNSLFLLHFNVD